MADPEHLNLLPGIPLLYEDRFLLAVAKPAGLLAQGDHTGNDNLLDLCKSALAKRGNRGSKAWLGLLHRLDRPVGGAMLFAKTPAAAASLSEQIRKRLIQKHYLAAVQGETPPNGLLTDRLVKENHTNTVRVAGESDAGGMDAELHYLKIASAPKDHLSLIRVHLVTGRPHQIRVQFASRGFPIVGDRKYGKTGSGHRAPMALHAFRIDFQHPDTGDRTTIVSPPEKAWPWTLFELPGE
ncbi:MAG: RluA family pseudouridine synthase [Balneolaceae bacterium]